MADPLQHTLPWPLAAVGDATRALERFQDRITADRSRARSVMNVRAELWLPQPREAVFPFFADARNLEAITPPWLAFRFAGEPPERVGCGSSIDYRLRVHGLPLRWRSEITVWEPPFRFRDEQVRGPYRRWSHTHLFVPLDGGTLCIDEVEYEIWGGRLVERLFVREDVRQIFEFRQEALLRHFTPADDPRVSAVQKLWRVVVRPSAPSGPGG